MIDHLLCFLSVRLNFFSPGFPSLHQGNVLALFWLVFLIGGCTAIPDSERLTPSNAAIPFDGNRFADFGDYLSQIKADLQKNKIFMVAKNADIELAAAAPFELRPAKACPAGKPRKGILLIHGLSDMPFAMRDLSEEFASRCFLVRGILLPGHGTRAGDLLEVTREDWLNAARFALQTLKTDAEEVYTGGFSLGGLASTILAVEDDSVKGIFAFSPALSLKRSWQLRQSRWLRYIVEWADTDEPDDFARFEAMPVNALAETYLLTQHLKRLLREKSVKVPLFLAQSIDDAIIDTEENHYYFTNHFSSPLSKSIVYKQNPTVESNTKDPRIKYVNSYLPEQRIAGFSHQSVHISPTNFHYGLNGKYRNCGASGGRGSAEVEKCMKSEKLWFAEIVGSSSPKLPKGAVAARLTFNPRFEELMAEIDAFLFGLNGKTKASF